MGRAAVRSAVAAYFSNATIPFVGTVYSARNYINEQDYANYTANVNGSGAVLVVNVTEDDRERRADTGRGAVNDTDIHHVAVEVFFASTVGDPIAAQGDYDTLIDSLFELIRADANLGDPTVVWSAGEYAPWIKHHQTAPYTDADGMTVFINGAVLFDAWEFIAGSNV